MPLLNCLVEIYRICIVYKNSCRAYELKYSYPWRLADGYNINGTLANHGHFLLFPSPERKHNVKNE
jgi:hypothetical protein